MGKYVFRCRKCWDDVLVNRTDKKVVCKKCGAERYHHGTMKGKPKKNGADQE